MLDQERLGKFSGTNRTSIAYQGHPTGLGRCLMVAVGGFDPAVDSRLIVEENPAGPGPQSFPLIEGQLGAAVA